MCIRDRWLCRYKNLSRFCLQKCTYVYFTHSGNPDGIFIRIRKKNNTMLCITIQINWCWEYDSCRNCCIKRFFNVVRFKNYFAKWVNFIRRVSIDHWSQLYCDR